jgi:hypothetical protein
MSNVLSDMKQEQVVALGRLGWSLRRIEKETGVRRETASLYLRAADVTVRKPGWRGCTAKPAMEVSTDSSAGVPPSRSPQASACEPHRDFIEESLHKGRNAMAIWQDLVDDYAFQARYGTANYDLPDRLLVAARLQPR